MAQLNKLPCWVKQSRELSKYEEKKKGECLKKQSCRCYYRNYIKEKLLGNSKYYADLLTFGGFL